MSAVGETPVVILAGGRGTRFDHETQMRPKPMIEVAGRPILQHIIDSLVGQGFWEFYVLTGYLREQVDAYFAEVATAAALGHYSVGGPCPYWVRTVDTGPEAHTGLRLWRAREAIGRRRFVLTYGDGLSDVDMADVIRQHDVTGAGVTVTAVRPPGRFGVLEFPSGPGATLVEAIHEKSAVDWINGGFMVVEPEFVERFIEGGFELESTALPELAASGGLHAYRHRGYWRCMDTRRDREQIEDDVVRVGRLPWMR